MTTGLDPKRIKNVGNFVDDSPAESLQTNDLIGNKFDGEGNPDQGEQYDYGNLDGVNRFPREGGHDTYTDIPGDGIVPG